MAFNPVRYDNPFEALTGGMKFGQDYFQNMKMNPLLVQQQQQLNALNEFKRQYEAQRSKNYPGLLAAELAKAQTEPKEIEARTGLYGKQGEEITQKMKYFPQEFASKMAYQRAQIKEQEALAGLHGQQAQKEALMTQQLKSMFADTSSQGIIPENTMTSQSPEYQNLSGNYGIVMPKPTREDMVNKMVLGTDTFTPKLQSAMKQTQEQQGIYQSKLADINKQLEASRSFNNIAHKYDTYMDNAYFTGKVFGHLPAWGSDISQAQQAVDEMSPAAVHDFRQAMGTGQFAVADLNAALRPKPSTTWNKELRKNFIEGRDAMYNRLEQQKQFYAVANSAKIPSELTDTAWQLYQDKYRVFNKNGDKVVKRKGDEWQQYLTPKALASIKSTGSYNPINQEHINEKNIQDTMKETGLKIDEVISKLAEQGFDVSGL